MSLKQALYFCDANSTDEMLTIYSHFSTEKKFESDLIECLARNDLEESASWILKHHLEQGFMLASKFESMVIKAFFNMDHWEARLHILQILPLVQIAYEQTEDLWHHVEKQTRDKNKLIRAWSYNGLHAIATQHSNYKDKATHYLKKALDEESAASVLVRIKKIMSAGDYEQS